MDFNKKIILIQFLIILTFLFNKNNVQVLKKINFIRGVNLSFYHNLTLFFILFLLYCLFLLSSLFSVFVSALMVRMSSSTFTLKSSFLKPGATTSTQKHLSSSEIFTEGRGAVALGQLEPKIFSTSKKSFNHGFWLFLFTIL